MLQAEELARKHDRPIFLFTHDGKMQVGRCGGGAFAMRAAPLANANVIELLNAYFVPVYTSNDEVPGPAEVAKKEQGVFRGRASGW